MDFPMHEVVGSQPGFCWGQLLKEIHNLERQTQSQWIFRALDKWDGRTASGYKRDIPSSFDDALKRRFGMTQPGDRRLYESWMLLDFKREAHNYLTQLPRPNDFLEWMALGRHYGMPSRLVDFTYSFPVAAYFALSKRLKAEDACILAINLTWMKQDVELKLKTDWSKKHGLPDEQASFHNPELFQKFAFEWAETYVVPVNPLRRNLRLAKQHGLFLCPGNIEKDFDKNLKETLGETLNVKRLVCVHSYSKTEAMRDLRGMNVSLSTLYPDLSGWAESRRDLVHLDIPDDRFRKELENALNNPRI
jgi:hypothetical protein